MIHLKAATERGMHVLWRERIQSLVVVLLIMVVSIYGLLAIQTGKTLLDMDYAHSGQSVAAMEKVRAVAEAGGKVESLPQTAVVAPLWIRAMAAVTSDTYSYSARSVWDTAIVYAQMPDWHRTLLSCHMVLGGLAMLVGGVQFWPAFRRRLPRLHRRLGLFYAVTVQVSMLFSMAYLVVTPVDLIFSKLVFYVGLWLLAITVTMSLWLSIYHILRREIAQHQVWMALNFGLLLTAPLLRYDWVLIGRLIPGISQYAGNLSVMVFLIPQSFLTGYLILCFTRRRQKDRPQLPALAIADRTLQLKPLWFPVALLMMAGLAWLTLDHYWFSPGLAGSELAQKLVPAGVVALDSQVVVAQMGLRAAFVMAVLATLIEAAVFLSLAFVKTASQLQQAALRRTTIAMALPALVAALIQLLWGWQSGVPGDAVLSGGTFYCLNGLVLGGFALAALAAALKGRISLVKEWGVMTILALMAAPLFYSNLQILDLLAVPPRFIDGGHVYMLAASGGSIMLMLGFVYVAYGQATREKFAA